MNTFDKLNFLEIHLRTPSDFLKIKESLTRMGIPGSEDGVKVLYQSCHILHKKGRYFICHFKELLLLDGKTVEITPEDIDRRNACAALLEEWNLCSILAHDAVVSSNPQKSRIKVIKHAEKDEWVLQPKYNIGVKRGEFKPET